MLKYHNTFTQCLHNTSCCFSNVLTLSLSVIHTHTHKQTAYIRCTHARGYRLNDLVCGLLCKPAVLTCLTFCVCCCRRVKVRRSLLNHSCIFAHYLYLSSSLCSLFLYGTLQDLTFTLIDFSRVPCCVLYSAGSIEGRCI